MLTTRTCVHCGAAYPFRWPGSLLAYCSTACKKAAASKMHIENRRARPPYRVCSVCEGGFLAATARATCSDECAREARRRAAVRSFLVVAQPRWRPAAAA